MGGHLNKIIRLICCFSWCNRKENGWHVIHSVMRFLCKLMVMHSGDIGVFLLWFSELCALIFMILICWPPEARGKCSWTNFNDYHNRRSVALGGTASSASGLPSAPLEAIVDPEEVHQAA